MTAAVFYRLKSLWNPLFYQFGLLHHPNSLGLDRPLFEDHFTLIYYFFDHFDFRARFSLIFPLNFFIYSHFCPHLCLRFLHCLFHHLDFLDFTRHRFIYYLSSFDDLGVEVGGRGQLCLGFKHRLLNHTLHWLKHRLFCCIVHFFPYGFLYCPVLVFRMHVTILVLVFLYLFLYFCSPKGGLIVVGSCTAPGASCCLA